MALFFALACAITWALDAPFVYYCLRHQETPGGLLALVGLGAFGPTLAAYLLARRRGTLRETFGRWRPTSWAWVLVGLGTPAALHLVANVLEVALGGAPSQWFYPPNSREAIAALVFFSIGEEFGWRGFAQPLAVERIGPVGGSLLVGAVWGLWHLGMSFTPAGGLPDPAVFLPGVLELTLYAVVFGLLFERSGRSMAVAIALHAGGHLDNTSHAPITELRLRALRLAVVAAAAIVAAALLRRDARGGAPAPDAGHKHE